MSNVIKGIQINLFDLHAFFFGIDVIVIALLNLSAPKEHSASDSD